MPRKRKSQKTRTKIKILTPDKLLTRIPILLAQGKVENNSYKQKKTGKYCIFCINMIKSPKHFTTI